MSEKSKTDLKPPMIDVRLSPNSRHWISQLQVGFVPIPEVAILVVEDVAISRISQVLRSRRLQRAATLSGKSRNLARSMGSGYAVGRHRTEIADFLLRRCCQHSHGTVVRAAARAVYVQ